MGDKSDNFHHQALRIRDELKIFRADFVTSSAVVLELTSYFSQSLKRLTAIAMIEAISRSPKWECVMTDEMLMERGFERYKKMSDKNWSLADCIGMIVAQDHGITDIFTTDHHFEQAGFTILLQPV